MAPTRVSRAQAEQLAVAACGWAPEAGPLVEIDTGFGNHNWRVPSGPTGTVLKVGPASSAKKWAAAEVGAAVARVNAVPAPAMRSVQVVSDHVVRAFDWVDGEVATSLTGNHSAQSRLGHDLGMAIARLHTSGGASAFTSRLDGSTPSFARWADYVADRLDVIERRAMDADAPEPRLRRRAARTTERLAAEVSSRCEPVVCHRDLHPDNLVVTGEGCLTGVLDWDMAEGWDAAGEWFKLELFLFERLPAARASFEDGYASIREVVDADRRRVVLLMESLNVVANAGAFTAPFVDFGLEQLRLLC